MGSLPPSHTVLCCHGAVHTPHTDHCTVHMDGKRYTQPRGVHCSPLPLPQLSRDALACRTPLTCPPSLLHRSEEPADAELKAGPWGGTVGGVRYESPNKGHTP